MSGTAQHSRIFTLQQEGLLILWSLPLPALQVSVSVNKDIAQKKEAQNSPFSEVSAKKTLIHSQALHMHCPVSPGEDTYPHQVLQGQWVPLAVEAVPGHIAGRSSQVEKVVGGSLVGDAVPRTPARNFLKEALKYWWKWRDLPRLDLPLDASLQGWLFFWLMRLIFCHMHTLWFCGSLVKGYCCQDRLEHKKKNGWTKS